MIKIQMYVYLSFLCKESTLEPQTRFANLFFDTKNVFLWGEMNGSETKETKRVWQLSRFCLQMHHSTLLEFRGIWKQTPRTFRVPLCNIRLLNKESWCFCASQSSRRVETKFRLSSGPQKSPKNEYRVLDIFPVKWQISSFLSLTLNERTLNVFWGGAPFFSRFF